MIIYNAIKCNHCHDVIVSRHRHDFVKCTCLSIFVDGGLDYLRRGYKYPSDIIDLSLEDNAPFETIRQYFDRYNGISKKYVKLKDIDNEWLENIITWFIDKNLEFTRIFRLFLEEKIYRNEKEIYVV